MKGKTKSYTAEVRSEDFLEMQREVGILRKNVRDIQEQLQEAYKKIKELGEKYESTTREN
jgi:peptidoglycan hydrolase CwlO-like protein